MTEDARAGQRSGHADPAYRELQRPRRRAALPGGRDVCAVCLGAVDGTA